MRKPSPNFTRLQYLSDTLRRRFPGFVDEDANPRPQSLADGDDRFELTRIEAEVRALFAGSIPRHPAYNNQVLFALATFRANNVAALNPDDASLRRIVQAVNDRQPRFKPLIAFDGTGYRFGPLIEDTLTLHALLQDYSTIKGGDLHAFPSIETMGYHRDENTLRRFEFGPALERKRRKINVDREWDNLTEQDLAALDLAQDERSEITQALAGDGSPPDIWVEASVDRIDNLLLRRKQLRAINKHLDERCPAGSYFNRTRQEVIHIVWSNRRVIQDYKDAAENRRRQGKARKDGSVWVDPEKQLPFNDVIVSTMRVLAVARRNLAHVAPSPRPMSPEDAIKIDKLLMAHLDASLMGHREGRNPEALLRAGLPRHHVPERIKRAATTDREGNARTNLDAARWAETCADTVAEIIPFEDRATLSKRIALQEDVFANRDHFFGGTGEIERFTTRPYLFRTRYHNLLHKKHDLLERLARELDNYDNAWQGRLNLNKDGLSASAGATLPISAGSHVSEQTARRLQNSSWGASTFDLSDSEDSGHAKRKRPPNHRPSAAGTPTSPQQRDANRLRHRSWAAPAFDLSGSEDSDAERPQRKRLRYDTSSAPAAASRNAQPPVFAPESPEQRALRRLPNTSWSTPAFDLSDSEDSDAERPQRKRLRYDTSSTAAGAASRNSSSAVVAPSRPEQRAPSSLPNTSWSTPAFNLSDSEDSQTGPPERGSLSGSGLTKRQGTLRERPRDRDQARGA